MRTPHRCLSPFYVVLSISMGAFIFAGCETEGDETGSTSVTAAASATTGTSAATSTGTSTSTGTTTGGGGGGSMDPSCGAESPTCDFMTDVVTYCVENHCGSTDNIEFAFCSIDEHIGCFCNTGTCSRDECVESGTCDIEDPASEAQCAAEAAAACGGEEFVREGEAFCTVWGLDIFLCEWLCTHGGSPACRPDET